MKKVLFLIALVAALFAAPVVQAQRATLIALAAGDSISTAASKDTVYKVISVTGGYTALGVQVVATKVSGTVVGKAYLYGSLDGTNYVITDSSSAFANQTTNVASFSKTGGLPWVYYKVELRVSDGANSTQVYIPRIYYVLRKAD